MTSRRAVTVALVAVFVLGILVAVRGIAVWPFEDDKKALAGILGSAAAPWLEDAEIATWQPDPSLKAQTYFVVRPMSAGEFRAWATAAGLTLSQGPSVPSGVLVLPDGVAPSRWLSSPREAAADVDAQGTSPKAILWSRWREGVAYTVVTPTY